MEEDSDSVHMLKSQGFDVLPPKGYKFDNTRPTIRVKDLTQVDTYSIYIDANQDEYYCFLDALFPVVKLAGKKDIFNILKSLALRKASYDDINTVINSETKRKGNSSGNAFITNQLKYNGYGK